MAGDDADRLYGLPLERFTAERDALAKRLRAAGDREAAERVRRLPKPTRAAWAVNRLARERAEEVRALVEAGEALAAAQDELLGGGDREVLRRAGEAARALVNALAREAGVSGVTAEKVRATLHAATVDPEARAELAAGRLVRERSAAGFGGLDGAAVATRAPRPSPRRAAPEPAPPRPDPREARRRRDALRRAKEAEAAAEAELAGAQRALEQVEATLEARRRALGEAQAALSEARRRRERAEEQAAE